MLRPVLSLRALIGALATVAFIIAAMPGAMAMPAPQGTMQHSMASMAGTASHAHHMKPMKEQGAPCKNMQICMGMLGCFGMAALTYEAVLPVGAPAGVDAPDLHQTLAGLTLPPEDRPPIG